MNKQEKYNEDLLRSYINPVRIEKAPEGFTSKVMARIQSDEVPVKASRMLWKRSRVPVISCAVTVLLITSVFLIPGNKSDFMALPALEILKNIKVTLPEIDLTSLFRLNVPVTMAYGLIGILLLSILDGAFHGVFHKEK
jgi:hypothetical protein